MEVRVEPVDFESMIQPERVARLDGVLSRRTRSLIVLLENLYDPHNAAASLRSCEAFGLQEVHVVESGNAFRPNRRVVRGSDKWLDVHRHKETDAALTALRARGYRVYTSDLSAARPIHELDFSGPCVLAFGNERDGASSALVEGSDQRFVIPMRGFCESFNVSVAVALSLFHAVGSRFPALEGPGDLAASDQAAIRRDWLRLAVKRGDDIDEVVTRRKRRRHGRVPDPAWLHPGVKDD